MKLFVDIGYGENNTAKAVGIIVDEHWNETFIIKSINEVLPYEPGHFYKRELPCILKIIEEIDINALEFIVIDGYVYLGIENKNGLGAHLYETLNRKVPVIGVAKTNFKGNENNAIKVYRGGSKNPLFVSSVGIDMKQSVDFIQHLKGEFRIPDILKILDQETKK